MLPLVINSDPTRLVQISLSGSVGALGKNARADVSLIQTMLNRVPEGTGGPSTKLAVDGLVGPKTIHAIQQFQKANTRVCDGRIDPNGPTLRALGEFLHRHNLLPTGFPNVGPPKPEFIRALSGISTPSYQSKSVASTSPVSKSKSLVADTYSSYNIDYMGPMGWKIVSTSGADASIKVVGLTFLNLYMTHDSEPGLTYRFTFAGSGVGLSSLPFGFNGSRASLPSYGTNVCRFSMQAKLPPINANDLVLSACLVSASANLPNTNGWSGSVIFIGAPVPLPGIADYVAAMTGMQFGVPGAGISFYVGAIAGWM